MFRHFKCLFQIKQSAEIFQSLILKISRKQYFFPFFVFCCFVQMPQVLMPCFFSYILLRKKAGTIFAVCKFLFFQKKLRIIFQSLFTDPCLCRSASFTYIDNSYRYVFFLWDHFSEKISQCCCFFQILSCTYCPFCRFMFFQRFLKFCAFFYFILMNIQASSFIRKHFSYPSYRKFHIGLSWAYKDISYINLSVLIHLSVFTVHSENIRTASLDTVCQNFKISFCISNCYISMLLKFYCNLCVFFIPSPHSGMVSSLQDAVFTQKSGHINLLHHPTFLLTPFFYRITSIAPKCFLNFAKHWALIAPYPAFPGKHWENILLRT